MKPRETDPVNKRNTLRHWILLAIGALILGFVQAPLLMAASAQHSKLISQQAKNSEYNFAATAQQVNGDHIAAAIADTQQRRQDVNHLLDQTKQTDTLLAKLSQLQQNEHLSPLQRDLTVHTYAMALRQMPEADVSTEVIHWLKQYSHQAWRHHDESNYYRIPAVNVVAAIDGTQNEWKYRAGQETAATAATNARVAIERYEQATESFQRGFEASMTALHEQGRNALLRQVMAHPHLNSSRLAGLLAVSNNTNESNPSSALKLWAKQAAPNAVLDVLRQASATLSQAAFLNFCQYLTQHPDDTVFGIALALAAEHWQVESLNTEQKQTWQALLIQQLADPERGVAAAHQLAKLSSSEEIAKWQAETTSSLAQQRLAVLAARHTGAAQ